MIAPQGDLHYLYRVYAADGALLYIGITSDLCARLRAHHRASPWWAHAARVTTVAERHLVAARAAEKKAIQAEGPIFNRVHNRAHTQGPIGTVQGLWITGTVPTKTPETRGETAKGPIGTVISPIDTYQDRVCAHKSKKPKRAGNGPYGPCPLNHHGHCHECRRTAKAAS